MQIQTHKNSQNNIPAKKFKLEYLYLLPENLYNNYRHAATIALIINRLQL